MAHRANESNDTQTREPPVSIYPAWCKRCGNCVAFCPTHALDNDEWGYPHLTHPEKCTSCHLCEKLCPDFAISIGEQHPPRGLKPRAARTPPDRHGTDLSHQHSPERLAPHANHEEEAPSDEE